MNVAHELIACTTPTRVTGHSGRVDLTIKGTKHQEAESQDRRYHLVERRTGTFSRSLTFEKPIDADHIAADLQDGILTVTLTKVPETKPRKIEVRSVRSAPTAPKGTNGGAAVETKGS